MTTFNAHGTISKVDDDKRQVFGWASITDLDGEPVVDHQNDWVAADELEKAVYDYVLKSRIGGTMHERVGKSQPKATSELIESIVITPEKIEKMGLPEGSLPLGWWTGFQVQDEDTWRKVKKGELGSFSIHGMGKREKVSKDSLRSIKKRREDQLVEVFKQCGRDERLFVKSIAFLADAAHQSGHPDAAFYAEVTKHLVGEIAKGTKVEGYTRSDGTKVSSHRRRGSRRKDESEDKSQSKDKAKTTRESTPVRGALLGGAIGAGMGSTIGPLGLAAGAAGGGVLGTWLGGRETPLIRPGSPPKKASGVFEQDGEKFITLADGRVVPVDDDDQKNARNAWMATVMHNMGATADNSTDSAELARGAMDFLDKLPPLWRDATKKEMEIEDKKREALARSDRGSVPGGGGPEEFGMTDDELAEFMGRHGATDLDDVRSILQREHGVDADERRRLARESMGKRQQPRLSDRDKQIIMKYMTK